MYDRSRHLLRIVVSTVLDEKIAELKELESRTHLDKNDIDASFADLEKSLDTFSVKMEREGLRDNDLDFDTFLVYYLDYKYNLALCNCEVPTVVPCDDCGAGC